MTSAHDVAAYILSKTGSIDAMKLQKLTYYAEAWHLAWEGKSMFPDAIEAWANGPVIPVLFAKHRGQFTIQTWSHGDPSQLTSGETGTVDAVLRFYKSYSGQQLGQQSHQEQPWREARGELPPGARCTTLIDRTVMQDYYGSLVA